MMKTLAVTPVPHRPGWNLLLVAIATFAPMAWAEKAVTAAVADSTRLEQQRAQDVQRKPQALLEFAFPDLKPGSVVADIVAGSGYYTAILSRVVGGEGLVYAVNPVRIFAAFPQARGAFPKYLEQDPRGNVLQSEQFLDELVLSRPLDAAMMVLYYHDTLWTGTDRAAMNKQIFAALKPGAHFLVVDHHARAGAPASVGKELHRMDAAIVRPELEAAGFEFFASSPLLENSDDPLNISVFDADIRGRTHRFAYVFRKPGV